MTVIGNGSNLLVGDKGIRGLVIEVGAQMNAVEVQEISCVRRQVPCFPRWLQKRQLPVWAAWNLLPEFREAWAVQ